MIDSGQRRSFFQGLASYHTWMMSPIMFLLCINRTRAGLACILSRLLNIWEGVIRSWCGVDWLHCETELIYIYNYTMILR